ncbi:hypothetical protein G7Y89_g10944 [Cudoniella acicularis]|uniref:Uncharacterized protein n=1 Tax=Cudoniella acicularis TaxID=354080 RepID=A0A8H4RBT0_9HELO|nr:hypothetical protein G7Y89_g10944 [Cudoniella acicularis]
MCKAMEDQASSRICRLGQKEIQIVIKFMLDGSWDDERMEKLASKALPDFYANITESDELRLNLKAEERKNLSKIKMRVAEVLGEQMGGPAKRSGIASLPFQYFCLQHFKCFCNCEIL